MRCGDSVIMPDRFIPLIVQFNLSQRFDMLVLETLFSMLHKHPGQRFGQPAACNSDAKEQRRADYRAVSTL